MKYVRFGIPIFVFVLFVLMILFVSNVFANQVGVNFTENTIGVLGDYEKSVEDIEFAVDAQAQKSDTTSLIGNVSLQYNFNDTVGFQPFGSYNKDELGGVVDVGGVVNFSIGALDISAGASFRGSDPVTDGGLDGFDADGNPIKYFTDDPSNTYTLPDVDNVNGVVRTAFERWKVENSVTAYVPITEREVVPVVLIGRSQMGIDVTEGLGLSLVVDTRTYIHNDGAEISFTPMGAIVFKF